MKKIRLFFLCTKGAVRPAPVAHALLLFCRRAFVIHILKQKSPRHAPDDPVFMSKSALLTKTCGYKPETKQRPLQPKGPAAFKTKDRGGSSGWCFVKFFFPRVRTNVHDLWCLHQANRESFCYKLWTFQCLHHDKMSTYSTLKMLSVAPKPSLLPICSFSFLQFSFGGSLFMDNVTNIHVKNETGGFWKFALGQLSHAAGRVWDGYECCNISFRDCTLPSNFVFGNMRWERLFE